MLLTTFLAVAAVPVLGSPAPLPASAGQDSSDGATPTTLTSGQLWIRAVEAPNFHKYLQTKPANTAGTAILDSYTTAGQFNIVDGQLVNGLGTPGPLYMQVEQPADPANPPRTLATSFNTSKNTFGTFVFQGDAVTWSAPTVKRQNLAAWLVCAKQQLFINTGAYNYQTPAGCADETVRDQSHALAVKNNNLRKRS